MEYTLCIAVHTGVQEDLQRINIHYDLLSSNL